MEQMQQHDDRHDAVDRAIATAESTGKVTGKFHELALSAETPEIWVRDLRTNQLVAYSSTRADFRQSLEEFVVDYFA